MGDYLDFSLEEREWWVNDDWTTFAPDIVRKPVPELKGPLRLRYPLHQPREFEPRGGWTWETFALVIAGCYQEAYQEPANVWGHVLAELVLEGSARLVDGFWVPDIGS